MKYQKNLLENSTIEQESKNMISNLVIKRFENFSCNALTKMIDELEQIADVMKWEKNHVNNIDPLLFIYNEIHFACNNNSSSYTIQTTNGHFIIRNYPKDLLNHLEELCLLDKMENIRKSTVNDFTSAQMK